MLLVFPEATKIILLGQLVWNAPRVATMLSLGSLHSLELEARVAGGDPEGGARMFSDGASL
jgi:hypothetical protein